jgi:hypothetical protein
MTLDGQQAQGTTELTGNFDRSPFSARIALEHIEPPALNFMLNIDQLDANAYRPATARSTSTNKTATSWAVPQGADLRGEVRIGLLKIAGLQARNLRLEAQSTDGQLKVRNLPSPARP